jgi:hypothetical protein
VSSANGITHFKETNLDYNRKLRTIRLIYEAAKNYLKIGMIEIDYLFSKNISKNGMIKQEN